MTSESTSAAEQNLLREYTKQVQRDAATARELTEQVQSLLVASRDAVDTVSVPEADTESIPSSEQAPRLDPSEQELAQMAATHLREATMAVVTGQPIDPAASVSELMAGVKKLTTSEQFAPIREALARQIVSLAVQQIVKVSKPEIRHVFTEDTTRLLLKLAIQGLRGAVTSHNATDVIEHAR